MAKNITKRYKKQELDTPKATSVITIYEKDIVEIEEVDIKDVPEDALMETVIVIPDESDNLEKALKKNRKQSKQVENNIEQKTMDNE